MKLQIGENLRFLRRDKDITQEELAEVLGVSYQSVSRWENNTCYPDMELLPSIADFFNITVDKLLGVNEAMEREKVNCYLERFQNAISCGDVDKCIAIAREGVAEYPNNFFLLNKLMYALFIAGDSDGNISEWKENMQKYDSEITALGERIMKYCPDQDIRLEATARLAFNHCEMGRKEQGRAIYETLPSQTYCKENQILGSLTDDEKLPFTRDMIEKHYLGLYTGLYNIAWSKLLPDEQLLLIFDKMFTLDQFIYDHEHNPDLYFNSAQNRYGMSRVYVRLNQYDKAMEQLQIAADNAIAFDNRPESGVVNCLLLGEKAWKRTDFETVDTRACREIMRDKWLGSNDFDCVRNTEGFKEIINMLS